jgi:hypothetical protein
MTFALRIPEKICQTRSQRESHVTFVLSWRAKTGQDASASSSLGVSLEFDLTIFPQGQPRRGLALQK